MDSVPSEEANVQLESYLPIVSIEENSQEESRLETGLAKSYSQYSNLYGARRDPQSSQLSHVGGWGGGPEHTKTVKATLPQFYSGYDNERNVSGRVEEVEDARRSRFLQKRADIVKENQISISVERNHDKSFQDFLKLEQEPSSRRLSLEPSAKGSPTHSNGGVFNVSVIRKHSQGAPIQLLRQPTDNFTKVFVKAGIDPHLLEKRLMNASKADSEKKDLPTVRESQNRVCLTAESAVLQDEKKKTKRITAVQFMERALSNEEVETLRSIFLKHSTVSDTKGESVMKLWQFRKFSIDFGLAQGAKAVAEMQVLYNAMTRDKQGHSHQRTFLMIIIEIAKKHYGWLSKEKAFKNLVERYLMKNFQDTKNSLELDVALREYFRAFKYEQLSPAIPPKVLDHIYTKFCSRNQSGINVTGFQKLTRHLRINPVFCSDLQTIRVYKYLEQMQLHTGPVLKKETLQIALYLLFLPAVQQEAPFKKRWKFLVKWVTSAFYKLERPIK